LDRQGAIPLLKTKRSRSVSRAFYPKADRLDETIDRCIEYEADSRRLGPRLLKVQAIEQKLEEAQAAQDSARRRHRTARRQFEEIRADQHGKLDERLEGEMIEYGTHLPTSIPLEYSKFSTKILDMRERERKAAWFRRYEDATVLRTEAHKRERQELDAMNGRFARAYALGKNEVARKQGMRRDAFQQHWQSKKEQSERPAAREIEVTGRAIAHWERQLTDAHAALGAECRRIERNERIVSTPVAARATATRRF
jgi:hypothetical protein